MVSLADSQRFMRMNARSYWSIVLVAIFALTASVTTRTSVLILPHSSVALDSQPSSAFRQHLDSDAMQWVPPVAPVAIAEVVSFYPRISPAGPPIPSLLFDKSLYNRPPPAC
jgi:hypothetical protein